MIEGFVDSSSILQSGVYALVSRGVVVYIGQAKRMLSRIEAHRSTAGRREVPSWFPVKGIQFDAVWVMPAPVDLLDQLERGLIARYRPRFNVRLKPPGLPEVLQITARPGQVVHVSMARPVSKFERRI